ncbi:MAG: LPS export ABC transporter periplasmic protein LptC [Sphingomonadales bacterium]|nr:LPS export ABC transporter periplasmic protein LptC [Sphingomonadales bacterium]MDE2170074.1 LPS export ABC transporter periplasmic protein LptC [Sphingomonadales bacterium]
MILSRRQLQDKRRALALPGCKRERLMVAVGRILPGMAGVVVALMVVTPLFPHNSVSFLLDRNKVAVTENRLQVQNAAYRGVDLKGRAFELSADNAVQKSARDAHVTMSNLVGTMALADGPGRIEAASGSFDMTHEQLTVPGDVHFQQAGGYDIRAHEVVFDARRNTVESSGAVEGLIPSGQFSAGRMSANLDAHTVRLEGRAHLRMTPGAPARRISQDLMPPRNAAPAH